MHESPAAHGQGRGIRWWPAALILLAATVGVVLIRANGEAPFQERNLNTLKVLLGAGLLLLLWWLAASRAAWRVRLWGCGALLLAGLAGAALVLVRGVTGDLIPILEWRWTGSSRAARGPAAVPVKRAEVRADFPQFLGPNRNGMVEGPLIGTNWAERPPEVLWRRPVGAGWGGFAIVGDRAVTQEQQGGEELVVCYDLTTGEPQWAHADKTRYFTTIAGEGPRCTPTIVSNRVFTLGATGRLNCLDLANGRQVWSRSITDDAQAEMPEWGFSGSPLVFDGLVVVSAGGESGKSLLAYRMENGEIAWAGGSSPANYGSPSLHTLAGRRQVVVLNKRSVAGHNAATGEVLWERPWGVGYPLVAMPIPVSTNRLLVTAGYGVGAELLELRAGVAERLEAEAVWSSRRLKAKFANPVLVGGLVYGLDDGILACVDVADGSLRWKEGRYGHGQGVWRRDQLLLLAENGELVLLRPTPREAGELARFRVFAGKTWNPPALSGSLLLVRNDREAALLRLPAQP